MTSMLLETFPVLPNLDESAVGVHETECFPTSSPYLALYFGWKDKGKILICFK